MQDLGDVVVGAAPRLAHLTTVGVGVGRQRLLLRASLQVDEQAVWVLVPALTGAPARVARLEGEAGQEDQPEPLAVEVEGARVVLDPAYGQAGGLCFKARPV